MAESIRVRVPPQLPSPNPKICCNRATNCCSAPLILANLANFTKSAAPARFIYFNHDGLWIDFENEVLESLKPAFLDGKAVIEMSFRESRYLFDFTRMLQIDFDSGIQRSIAWIDVNGKCFFPKMFVREDSGDNLEEERLSNRKIEIEVNIDGNSIKRKREEFRDKEEPEVTSSKKEEDGLKRQRLGMRDVGNCRWLNTRVFKEEEKSYSPVKNYFLSGMKKIDPDVVITAIHQCTRKGLSGEARQEVFLKQIEITKAARGVSNTVYAWYGAPAKEVESILAHGFGGPRKVSAGETYGVGVYLSPFGLPHMSAKFAEADDNGEKHIILCRVILGNVETVVAGSQQYYPSSIDFDTGTDDPKNPKWYVVWSSVMNRHIIPECVVSFKSSINVPGQVRGSTHTKYSLEKLFSKLRSWLPPEKIQEVAKLYDVYRAGKLTKNIFIRHLRGVAGDYVLLSAIREIRSSE
ncbi:probable inactive poly [ADP-ribose] polymerase SRO3 [Populus nigra]|uniref:probable inactive poly [ADP-ribose] polymerase SRO3 n=1 Tax=Populus nigra TaxID=3691 RepID=UPI002B276162|nr:probable inactive poly [ADP-ribose] polymerase SRO3 [Populus nigra]